MLYHYTFTRVYQKVIDFGLLAQYGVKNIILYMCKTNIGKTAFDLFIWNSD